jgi:hypothetical protein
MIVERIDKKRECFSDYTLSEVVLTIGGKPIDLQAEQQEQEVIITFCRYGNEVHRGMMPNCEYAAEVIIPPRKYRSVEVRDTPRGETTEGEGMEEETEPKTHTEMVAVPLDSDTVVLQLWPIGTEYEKENEGGM